MSNSNFPPFMAQR